MSKPPSPFRFSGMGLAGSSEYFKAEPSPLGTNMFWGRCVPAPLIPNPYGTAPKLMPVLDEPTANGALSHLVILKLESYRYSNSPTSLKPWIRIPLGVDSRNADGESVWSV